MQQHRLWFVVPAAALAVVVGTVVRCGTGGADGSSDGAAADAATLDAEDAESSALPEVGADVTNDVTEEVDAPCVVPPKPSHVPPNWVEFTEWSCERPFYIPTSTDDMPEPVQWEPCSDKVDASLDCRSMKITWPSRSMSPRCASPA